MRETKSDGWNYRIFREKIDGEYTYNIRDVYYNNKGKPKAWGKDPQYPRGETKYNLASDLIAMQRAILSPILEVTKKNTVVEVKVNIFTN